MRYCTMVAALFLLASFAFGADVDGKWTGKITGFDGNDITINYTFKAEGTTLTGSTTGPDGNQIPIKNGKIEGNNLSFSISFDFGGQEMKIDYKGVVSADQVKLTFDMMGQPAELILTRAN